MKKQLLLLLFTTFMATGPIAQPCFVSGITFTSQAQIDSFAINFPNCDSIDGPLIINGTDITNLSGLTQIVDLGHNLYIGTENGGNPNLTSISGLNNVKRIQYGLYVYNNPVLEDLTGLDSIFSLNGSCRIVNNANLISFQGLNNIQAIKEFFYLYDNPRIKNMSGLDNLRWVKIAFHVVNNDSLESFVGLTNFLQIDGGFYIANNERLNTTDGLDKLYYIRQSIYIENNPSLQRISSMNELEELQSSLKITGNNTLDSITGFNKLLKIPEGFVKIEDCPDLVSIQGFKKLREVGSLYLNRNSKLATLEGLESLYYINGTLELNNDGIQGDSALASLQGLENLRRVSNLYIKNQPILNDLTALYNLQKVMTDLDIRNNLELATLEGLDNINASSLDELSIANNPQLNRCSIKSICEYLSLSAGYSYINSNEDGCNSEEEIENKCFFVGDNFENESNITLYPIPADTYIKHKQLHNKIVEYTIMDYYGKVVGTGKSNGKINLEYLSPGTYLLILHDSKELLRSKVIIH